jgi:hypothetical protein
VSERPNNAMQLTRGGLEPCGSIIVGNEAIVNQGEVVRPSQLIASVGQTVGTLSEPTRQEGA